MANLHNRVSRKELKGRIEKDNTPRTTISFYNYIYIPDPQLFRDEMYKQFLEVGVLGRIYVANEGINAQISVPTANLEDFKSCLYMLPGFEGLRLNIAVDDNGKSFFVLDVKVRRKIVADGIEDPSFNMVRKGKYVNAEQFNKLTDDPNTVIIDMRNHEYEVGHLKMLFKLSDISSYPLAGDMMEEKDATSPRITGGSGAEGECFMLHQGFLMFFTWKAASSITAGV
jgi:UPF0176 protein